MTFEQVKLPYEYNDLEPYMDKETMHIHYDKHHAAYTANFNAAIQKHPELFEKTAEEILSDLQAIPEDIRSAVTNHGGGYFNHNFFWLGLKKGEEGNIAKGDILEAINTKWGSFDNFKEEFNKAAATQFGSGWAWLVFKDGELEICKYSNQDCPLSEGKIPLLTIDVWEHAYYLKYRNKRPEFINSYWNIINWDRVNELFKQAQ